MAAKVKFRVPNLAFWPALLWPGAAPAMRDRVQPWARFHEALTRHRRVVAEFGIGRGDYLRGRAAAEPATLFLGVEASLHFVRYADRFAREAGLANLFLAFGDARLTVLPAYVPPGSLDEAHYLFPDPWTRKRHAWRRMLAARNVPYVLRALRPGGLLRLRTDVPAYIDDALESFAALGLQPSEQSQNRDPQQAVTRWERRKLAEGLVIGEVRYIKPADCEVRLREMGVWPGMEDVPLDLRGVAKHEPSMVRNAGYEPLPTPVADTERPAAAARTGYGPLARQNRSSDSNGQTMAAKPDKGDEP